MKFEKVFHLSKKDHNAVLLCPNSESFVDTIQKKHPAALLIPGGGYVALSEFEQKPLAHYFANYGFVPFILRYSLNKMAQYPRPLTQASAALWYIRSHASEYGIDTEKIAIIGFSAGAHLTTMLATQWNEQYSHNFSDIPEENQWAFTMPPEGNKPNATVTGYTPTTFENFEDNSGIPVNSEQGPGKLLASEGHFSQLSSLTTHTKVTDHTPPAFLFKCTSDFPPGTLEYAQACADHHVEAEVHIFADNLRCASAAVDPFSSHEYSANTQLWGTLAINWLRRELDF